MTLDMHCTRCNAETPHYVWTCQVCGFQVEGDEPTEDYPPYVNGPAEEAERMIDIQRRHK